MAEQPRARVLRLDLEAAQRQLAGTKTRHAIELEEARERVRVAQRRVNSEKN